MTAPIPYTIVPAHPAYPGGPLPNFDTSTAGSVDPLLASLLIATVAVLLYGLSSVLFDGPSPRLRRYVALLRRPRDFALVRAARNMITLAVTLAGRQRTYLLDTWRADLAGVPEHRRLLTPARQCRYAMSCLWAACRFRLRDLTTLAARQLDALLASDWFCYAVPALAVSTRSASLLWMYGLPGVLERFESLIALAGVLFAVPHGLRKLRGVRPRSTTRGDRR